MIIFKHDDYLGKFIICFDTIFNSFKKSLFFLQIFKRKNWLFYGKSVGKIYAIIHFDLNSKRSAIKFDTKHVTSHSNPYGNCKNEENTSKKIEKKT